MSRCNERLAKSRHVKLNVEPATAVEFRLKADIAAGTPGGPRAALSALAQAYGLKGGGLQLQPLSDDEQAMLDEAHEVLGYQPTREDADALLGRILDNLHGDERRNRRKKLMRWLGFEL
jgi:hypothetical protein